jgi:uncharacterized protein YbjQ (UPF0145 family)
MLTRETASEYGFRDSWPDGIEVDDPDVQLYTNAWVSGTRVQVYLGPVLAEIFVRDEDVKNRDCDWVDAQCELLEQLKSRARVKSANAVVGVELNFDPFATCPGDGRPALHLHAAGTAAKLERIA